MRIFVETLAIHVQSFILILGFRFCLFFLTLNLTELFFQRGRDYRVSLSFL